MYSLKTKSILDGKHMRTPGQAVLSEVQRDGLTRQERGMIDRSLRPKRKGASRKFVRHVRVAANPGNNKTMSRSGEVLCDLITEDKRLITIPMRKVLKMHLVSAERISSRARRYTLPASIAERLQTLKITDNIKRTILGAIPPSKRSTLQRRQKRKKMGPAPKAGKKDTKNDEHRRQKPQIETHGDGATGPRGRGCDAEGRAEGGGGRGSQEPRRGFPK